MLDRLKKRKRGAAFSFIRESDIKKLITVVFSILQPCMVMGALCVVSFIVYLWFTHLKNLNQGSIYDIKWVLSTLMGVWFLFNIIFNYLSAVLVHAGTARELFPNLNQKQLPKKTDGALTISILNQSESSSLSPSKSSNDNNTTDKDKFQQLISSKNASILRTYFFNEINFDQIRGLRNNPFTWRWCDECLVPKPPRSHHCSICQECILNMDHHCPWVASCVGICNYRYFVLFMFWVCLGCSYFLLNAFNYAGLNFFFIKSTYDRHAFRGDELLRKSQSRLMLGCVFSLAVTFAVGCLLSFHFYLSLSGLSTIEMFSTSKFSSYFRKKGLVWKSPSNNGWKKNWQYVFRTYGRFWWMTWCLPQLPNRKQILKTVMGDDNTSK